MTTLTRKSVFALSTSLVLGAMIALPAAAAPPKALLLAPGGSYSLPKFGFSSSTIYGFGEQVAYVRPGSRAWRLGLEPGDVILSLNGYDLTYSGSWNDALSRALYDGNYVRLKVRDVRTGNIYFRETYVDYNNGPVQHYYKTAKKFDSHPHEDFHHGNPTIKTIKEIKKLFD